MGTPRIVSHIIDANAFHEPRGFEKSLLGPMTNVLYVGVPTVRHVTVCEGNALKIECQGDQKLEITAAAFGRSAHGVCKGFFDLDLNTNCHTAAALEITKMECEGLQSCVLHATTTEYGNPCMLTKKYLTVCKACNCVLVCDFASLLIGSKKPTY